MVIYNTVIEAAELLPIEERGELFAACVYYASTGTRPSVSTPILEAILVSHGSLFEKQHRKMASTQSLPELSDDTKAQLAKGVPLFAKKGLPFSDGKGQPSVADKGQPSPTNKGSNRGEGRGVEGSYPPIAPQGAACIQNQNNSEPNPKVTKGEPLVSEKGQPLQDSHLDERREVIGYLNERLGTAFRPSSADTRRHIDARLNEGLTVADLKSVVDNRVRAWGNDPQMKQYLRPATLFNSAKCEGYLNDERRNHGTGGAPGEYDSIFG